MKIKYKLILVLFTVSLLTQNTTAQRDSISKEVVVIREYDPTIADAFKVNTMPGIPEKPTINKSFDYKVASIAFTPKISISPLEAQPFSEAQKYALYQNHITGGLGNYASLYGDLFYNAYNSTVHVLNIYGTHQSSFGHVKLEDDTKAFAPYAANQLGLGYTRRYKHAELKADLLFNSRTTRFYGYETINDTINYLYNDSIAVNGSDIKSSSRQNISDINLALQFGSLPDKKSTFQHHSMLSYSGLGDFYSNSENNFMLTTQIFAPLNDNAFGVDVQLSYWMCNEPSNYISYTSVLKNNLFQLKLTPYYFISGEGWKLKLGFTASGVQEQNEGFTFLPTPDVRFDVDLIKDIFKFYVKTSGNYEVSSYKSLSMENPFIAPYTKSIAVQKPIELETGIRASLISGLDISLFVNYSTFKNKYFYVNEIFKNASTNENVYSNQFTTQIDNGSLLNIKADIRYQGFDKLQLGLSGNYEKFMLDSLTNAWHIPTLKISIFGTYQITDKIESELVYQFRSVTKAQNADGSEKELPMVHDVSIKGSYVVNDRISAFLRINNLLAQKYYLWNGYSSQGINAMLGATYHF